MSDFSDVETLVAQRKKIHAIKELRSRTGLGLKDAKEAVEHYERHGQWPHHLRRPDPPEPAAGPPSDERLRSVEQLVAAGKKIHAIKELRSLTGWGLKDTKEAVDRFQAQGAWPGGLLAALGGGASQVSQTAVAPASGVRAELEEILARRQKIGAIKRLREVTGWGLRQSKDAVDHFESHGSWTPEVLAVLEGSDHAPAPAAIVQQAPAPTSSDPALATIVQHLGGAPEVRLAVDVRRSNQEGRLFMLLDRACFVRRAGGGWTLELEIPYDQVRHAESQAGIDTTLYVSYAHLHERFGLTPADAEAVLALFRVYAR